MLIPIVRAQWTSLLLLYFTFGGLTLYLYGFFPLKYHGGVEASWDDLPLKVANERVDPKTLYLGSRTRVVLMVIDALRYDFVDSKYMPYTSKMIQDGKACLHKARAEPPTVTMPRIKAMTTGSISNFIDVALNFGSSAVTDDSFLHQAKLNHKKMVFYGDDTWLRLFPDTFERSEGTTSFYVSDYTEVDLNVTRHLPEEISPAKPDWDLMILHYLGLDHIGHLEGPFSTKVVPKMFEMDKVIETIMNASKKWDGDFVLMICGDHGMKDSGGHGGASHNEVTVPLVLFQKSGCDPKQTEEINQVDIAPTMSYLLGIPIPRSNTGRILHQVLSGGGTDSNLLSERSLYALYYNSIININALIKMLGRDEVYNKESYRSYRLAIKHHEEWLLNKENSASAKGASGLYLEALSNMSEYLIKSVVDFDMFAIAIGIFIIVQTFVAQLLSSIASFNPEAGVDRSGILIYKSKSLFSRVIFMILTFIGCSFFFKVMCGITQTGSSLCKIHPVSVSTMTALIVIVVTNFAVIQNVCKNFPLLKKMSGLNVFEYFLIAGTVIHPYTYGGTSFIEEEHQTWYFFWTSLTFLILAYTGQVLLRYYQKKYENSTEVQDKLNLSMKMDMAARVLLPKWIFLMILHRFLRTLNQTGDKWAFLPDSGDWLNKDVNNEILSILYLAGLLTVILHCQHSLERTVAPFKTTSILIIGCVLCIYFYRVTTRAVHIPFIGNDLHLNEIYLIRIFWILIFAIVIIELWSSWIYFLHHYSLSFKISEYTEQKIITNVSYMGDAKNRTKERSHASDSIYCSIDNTIDSTSTQKNCHKLQMMTSRLYIFLIVMTLVCSLYLRPHNLMLVPSIFLTSNIVNKILDYKFHTITIKETSASKSVLFKTVIHFWIGAVFYFYQGNSNSLASIDLGSGYIGLESYIPPIVALQMAIHTYTGPILSAMLLFSNLILDYDEWNKFQIHLKECLSVLAILRTYPLILYTIICTFLRYHLFVWTVFSPKLLYELAATIISLAAMFFAVFISKSIVWQEKICLLKIAKLNIKPQKNNKKI